MEVKSTVRMVLVFAALGAVVYYGSRVYGNVSAKI